MPSSFLQIQDTGESAFPLFHSLSHTQGTEATLFTRLLKVLQQRAEKVEVLAKTKGGLLRVLKSVANQGEKTAKW